MTDTAKPKRSWFVLFIALGALLAVLLHQQKTPLQHQDQQQRAVPVTIQTVQQQPFQPHSIGYGEVKPSRVLHINAEINGRIRWLNPQLKKGAALQQGTAIIQIDPRDYELALSQANADLAAHRARLDELAVRKSNSKSSLTLIQQKLSVAEKELQRLDESKKFISVSQYDQQLGVVLNLRQERQAYRNEINILPTQQRVAEANIALAQAHIEEQQRNLERATIQMPFTALVNAVKVEQQQYIRTGETLTTLHGMESVEVAVQMPPYQLRPLIPKLGISPDQVLLKQLSELGLSATLNLAGYFTDLQWQGEVTHIGDNIDPNSRTGVVIVRVDHPYQQASVGQRPPLMAGMLTRVTIQGQPRPAIVIPRSALHQDQVYLLDQQRLKKQPVSIDYYQGEQVVIKSGLTPGDQLILTDLMPAVTGQRLRVVSGDNMANTDEPQNTRPAGAKRAETSSAKAGGSR